MLKKIKTNKMEKKSLLQKAKELSGKNKTKVSDEEFDLFVAWAKGEVSSLQIMKVLGFSNANSIYTRASQCFKEYVYRNENK